MAQLIVFDLDGTLIDSRLDLANAVNHMRVSFGFEPLKNETVVSYLGNGMTLLVSRSTADCNIDLDEAVRRVKSYYAEHLVDNTCLYSGVAAGVKRLHENGVRLAVVTNKPGDAAEAILNALGIGQYLDSVIGGDSEFPLKPEPDSLLALQQKFRAAPENCWIFGDHYTDLEAGRRAGFRRAFARYGIGDPRGETFDFEADSFEEFVTEVNHGK